MGRDGAVKGDFYDLRQCCCPYQVDVYSFGVLLCEMCIQEEPNREQREGQIDQMVNLDFQRLVRNCVERDPMLRPNMEEVIKDLKRMRRRNRLK